MKRVLFVLETSGASGQDNNRALVYRSEFDKAGIKTDFIGFQPQYPSWAIYPKTRLESRIGSSIEYLFYSQLKFAVQRKFNWQRIIHAAQKADVVYLIKVSSLELIEAIRKNSRAQLIYDLGDALWLPTFRPSYSQIDPILRIADAVTSDNPEALAYAKKYCQEVHLWNSYGQIEEFDARRKPKQSTSGGPLVIGWLGSPGTLYNLYHIWESLEDVFKKHPTLELRLVGTGTDPAKWPPFEKVRYTTCAGYTNAEMFNHVLEMDIGLFPMFDVENSAVRGIMKALVYMGGEAAVIASPRGQCNQLIEDGKNGFLANSRHEWATKIERLVEDGALRQRLSREALQLMRERYSMDKTFASLRRILNV